MQVGMTGMVWYRKEDWDALRKLFTDADRLHTTYEGWRAAAERGERTMTQQGHRVVRAEIRPVEFAAWCKQKGMQPNAAARNAFSNEVAHRALKAGGQE
jgi:hypothetical protein